MLSNKEIANLFAEKKLKRITNKQLATDLGITESTVSRWFNYKLKLSKQRENEIIEYINNHNDACERCGH
ncbi:helix-turn-helix domain-containing protein [Tenuibacillus multivorans]|uniref:Helix-turn-helix n=1 Tax=Tenuibacillus multivorans TaxID=237069 RepID=A0A1G9XSS5_9BACI|nr:helix-turn-helix transcriptional regulator [Tenuibacillus multivorans]GEL75782.1 hypothetical protein TMU01_00170 [Tenuibacillus multivorans]SDM99235.1 Helix-turn-helix [Tenuibacillus multivorans]